MTPAVQATKQWMLARLRTVRSGLQLVTAHIDQIGAELAADKITAKEAAYDLSVFEETPIHELGYLLTSLDDTTAELLTQWEANHARQATAPHKPKERVYRTPEATKQAFWYVVNQNDPVRLKRWLAQHPHDARYLQQELEKKCLLQA